MFRTLALTGTAAATLALGGLTPDRSADVETRFGAPVAVGNGTVRTYLTTDNGAPLELGIALSEGVMTGLHGNDHSVPGAVAMPDGHAMFEYTLALPQENPTPYRHVVFNWNPGGHEPPGVYDVPHFDFHFYTIDEAERRSIVPGPEFEKLAAQLPSADELPAGYVNTPAVPMMGVHWIDPKTPELNGKPFVHTFIAGSWAGRPTFLEPMITKAFLESKPDFRGEIPEVRRHAEPGWYPTAYRIRWDEEAREYRVALGEFVKR